MGWTRSIHVVGQRRGDMYGNLTQLALSESRLENEIHASIRAIWIGPRAPVQRRRADKRAAPTSSDLTTESINQHRVCISDARSGSSHDKRPSQRNALAPVRVLQGEQVFGLLCIQLRSRGHPKKRYLEAFAKRVSRSGRQRGSKWPECGKGMTLGWAND